jgi:hypothetical protein
MPEREMVMFMFIPLFFSTECVNSRGYDGPQLFPPPPISRETLLKMNGLSETSHLADAYKNPERNDER